jgi:hypothetical protein
MKEAHIELIRHAMPLWHANVTWAKELLVRAFTLTDARDILTSEHRRAQRIPNTCWNFRAHGVGIDIFRTPDVGGIDFDFDQPVPDEWRLRIFIERQVNDGQLSYELYRDLMDDEELLIQAIRAYELR